MSAATSMQFLTEMRVTTKLLAKIVKGLSPFMSNDSTRPHLHGMEIMISGASVRFAATDGHRLALFELPTDEIADCDNRGVWSKKCSFVLSHGDVTRLGKLLSGEPAPWVRVVFGPKSTTFHLFCGAFVADHVEAQFPPIEQVLGPYKGKRTMLGIMPTYLIDAARAFVEVECRYRAEWRKGEKPKQERKAPPNISIDVSGDECSPIVFTSPDRVPGLLVIVMPTKRSND